MAQDKEQNIDDILKQFEEQQQKLNDDLKALGLPDLNDLEAFDPFEGYPPLLIAISEADNGELTNTLQKMLNQGEDPNSVSPHGETA
ncbi:MAG TPA: hypothetical protein ENJ91_06775, partial [Rhodobacteraceae bacterium]|nr:hypothetical protein [Paracoccaceae bacterium]